MALSVATNTSASTAHRYLKTNDMEASRSLAKLSSGSLSYDLDGLRTRVEGK